MERIERSNWAVEGLGELTERARHNAGRVMVLKGVWLQLAKIRSPATRDISDLDLLVTCPNGRFWPTEWIVRGARHAETICVPGIRLLVDVHWRPFPYRFRRISTAHLFRAAKQQPDGYYFPSPLDGYAHLIGNFVKGRYGGTRRQFLEDLGSLAAHHQLGADEIAAHLDRLGVARAAAITLALAQSYGDAHAARVLSKLPRDRIGRALGLASVTTSRNRDQLPLWISYAADRSLIVSAGGLARRLRASV